MKSYGYCYNVMSSLPKSSILVTDLMWILGLTVEIKMHFYVSPVLCGHCLEVHVQCSGTVSTMLHCKLKSTSYPRENCIPGTIALMWSDKAPGKTATSSSSK